LECTKRIFLDDELSRKSALTFIRLSDEDACKLGRPVMPRLNSGISRRSIASLFILAVQLRAPGMGNTSFVFDLNDCPTFAVSDRQYSDYEDDAIIELGETTAVTEKIGKTRDIAKAYAFLAASILRLFSTSPEKYILAWNQIESGFETFYALRCPISDVNPKLKVIKAIHKQISLDDTFRNTLYRILWMSNSDSDQLSLKRFLYDIHVSHRHAYITYLCQTLYGIKLFYSCDDVCLEDT
jgi:hypothetical protein